MKTRLPYALGDVFSLPLENGAFARGVVARIAPQGRIILAYFFGPRLEHIEPNELSDLRPENAVLRIRCGDLGFLENEWVVFSKIPNFDKRIWVHPKEVFIQEFGPYKKIEIVEYDDDDPSEIIKSTRVYEDPGLERESLWGYKAVEKRLSRIL